MLPVTWFQIHRLESALSCSEPAYAYRSGNSTPESPNAATASFTELTKPISNGDSSSKRKKQARAMEQLLASVDCNPPDYLMPGYKDRLLTPMHILPKETKVDCTHKWLLSFGVAVTYQTYGPLDCRSSTLTNVHSLMNGSYWQCSFVAQTKHRNAILYTLIYRVVTRTSYQLEG